MGSRLAAEPIEDAPSAWSRSVDWHRVREALAHAAHFLPTQGPISVFVHHNTLHSLEGHSFDEALRVAKALYRCEVYFSEERYRFELRRGRIRPDDLFTALVNDLGDKADVLLGFQGTRCHLRLAMLKHPIPTTSPAGLRWLIAETDALRKFRADTAAVVRQRMLDDTRRWITRLRDSHTRQEESSLRPEGIVAESLREVIDGDGSHLPDLWSESQWEAFCLHLLWHTCEEGVRQTFDEKKKRHDVCRHRELVERLSGRDTDKLVHDVLIRFCSAYVDQGMARWELPERDRGFWAAFKALYGKPSHVALADPWLRELPRILDELDEEPWDPVSSITESLWELGVPAEEYDAFLQLTLLALGGWGGMLRQLETHAPWTPHPAPPGSLLDFVAVRLLLDRLAVQYVAHHELGYRGPLRDFRDWARGQFVFDREECIQSQAFTVFQLAQALGWSPRELSRLSAAEWSRVIDEIAAFSEHERRRIFHAAYERWYVIHALDAISIHSIVSNERLTATQSTSQLLESTGTRVRAQVVCCIDDREESFRRHLEELACDIETFGTAGFFAVPMYYKGAADAHYIPLCPIVLTPQHYVNEVPLWTLERDERRRAQTRRTLGNASYRVRVGSHTFWLGTITALLGPLASIPLILRVLFPLLSAKIRNAWGGIVQPPLLTYLELERIAAEPSQQQGHHGFSVIEMANMVERLLQDIGLREQFARIVLIMGHGSSSLNNPHESAYHCGACGGGRGGPNARAMASMANDHRVRRILAERGLELSDDVKFIGAYHNTCDDNIRYFDLERLPATHRADFLWLREKINTARELNAHERCRWFRSADPYILPRDALVHVQERAEDLAQVRPEYNHATNAMCIVARRRRTRGLFLDRRSFLCSYDPELDDENGAILARILQAVIPVCAGISLEYYFSCVDPEGFGCGSKLPHNITSFLGVMDGAASDLRTGLSRQMVETHEPMRILFVIESTPQTLLKIIDHSPLIRQLCHHRWIQLATLDPESAALHEWNGSHFVRYEMASDRIPAVERSQDWYRGWREHLGFAVIGRGTC
jgi:uncharacterized protein